MVSGTGHRAGSPASSAHPSAVFGNSGLPGSDHGFFVQFPHPGGEPRPPGAVMGWNTSLTHHRKFLISPARYLRADGTAADGQVVFWGEWEPPSEIIRRWKPQDHLPRALHRPFWIRPAGDGFRHNTDPWVFGDRMIWSNCRQAMAGRPNAMQRLTRGSVVCFGSRIGDEFCLDTVMVIASAETWDPASGADLGAGAAFQICTAESVLCGGKVPPRLTLYRGATIDDPVNGMHSFVPAQLASAPDPRFTRSAIDLPGLINPKTRTPHRSRFMPPDDLHSKWDAIRRQVLAEGRILAVKIDTPPGKRQSA
jgi:hypothetical protein